ncbi:citrate/2-methylcitrate synthase [Schlesneria sp. T3-172]|uniref:citrate/2-methylcitrate synthase n=1 Tax=Schlesneria TaxID=656899 RepID=UPI002EFA1F84
MSHSAVPSPHMEKRTNSETTISSIDGDLLYRGYPVSELVEESSFLETTFLIVQGNLPSQEQLADMQAVMSEAAVLEQDIVNFIERLPLNVPAIDILRTGVNLLALSDAYEEELSPNDVWETLQRLLAQYPLLLATRHRIARGLEPAEPRDDLSYAGYLYWSLTDREPSPLAERALDAFLILSAEHELTPSTYCARIVASTRSDFLSSVIAGICAMKGVWHGGPGRQAIDILEAVESPAAAPSIVRAVLKQYERMPGFWHRVYRTSDPRSELLRPICRDVAVEVGKMNMEEVSSAIESAVWDEQQFLPSYDWPAARMLHYLGLDSDLFVPLFVISRTVGWAAHFIEQQQTPQPIRPRAVYVGQPERPFLPLSERG